MLKGDRDDDKKAKKDNKGDNKEKNKKEKDRDNKGEHKDNKGEHKDKGDNKKIQYLTDGVVVRSNEISFENENKPKYTIAFKFEDIKYEGVIG